METTFEFQPRTDAEEVTLEEAVYQAVGAASVCWVMQGRDRVFDSDRARAIADTLLQKINESIK